ncbi:MAG: alpha/beta hydrolase [Actinomycetota bacterium]
MALPSSRNTAAASDPAPGPATAAGASERIRDLGVPVHYAVWDGPDQRTFVLVHGLGGSHVNWLRVAPDLSSWGRTIAVDLAGFGRTPRGDRGASLPENRRLLSAFLAEVGTGELLLAGNSMGGGIALLQAAFEPGSVAGVIATSSIWPPLWTALPSPVVAGAFLAYRGRGTGAWMMKQRFEGMSSEQLVRLGFRLTTNDPERIPEDIVQAQIEVAEVHRRDPGGAAAFLDAARSIQRLYDRRRRFRAALDDIACPVLVVHGRDDRFVPAASAERAWLDHPDWSLRILNDCGHVPQLEAPERWLTAVEDWLEDRKL